MLESKFVKFLSILKWQVSSSSNFASFFIAMTCNSSVNFKLIHFLLWTKGSHQSPNFDTFKCSGENLPNSCHFPSNKSVFLQILHHSSMSWEITPLYVFSSNNIYFDQKEPIKVNIFETFECSDENLPNSSCHFPSNKSVFLQILHHSSLSWQITFMWIVKFILFQLWIKRSHQNPNFEAFKCSGENLPYSSCHFPNHKSVFLQILYHSSVSWKIILLYFFRSNVLYFARKEPIKPEILRILSAQV